MTTKKQVKAFVSDFQKEKLSKLCTYYGISESELIKTAVFSPDTYVEMFRIYEKNQSTN